MKTYSTLNPKPQQTSSQAYTRKRPGCRQRLRTKFKLLMSMVQGSGIRDGLRCLCHSLQPPESLEYLPDEDTHASFRFIRRCPQRGFLHESLAHAAIEEGCKGQECRYAPP